MKLKKQTQTNKQTKNNTSCFVYNPHNFEKGKFIIKSKIQHEFYRLVSTGTSTTSVLLLHDFFYFFKSHVIKHHLVYIFGFSQLHFEKSAWNILCDFVALTEHQALKAACTDLFWLSLYSVASLNTSNVTILNKRQMFSFQQPYIFISD